MDINVLFILTERLKSIEYILKLSFKRCLELVNSHSKALEFEAAATWFSHEKSKIESNLSKNSDTEIVNLDSFIEDHFEDKKEGVTNALNKMLF